MERFDDGALVLIGGHDLSYSHEVEIRFRGVAWFAGAPAFSHALFRAATDEELRTVPSAQRAQGRGFAIVTEHGNGEDSPAYLVVAEEVEVELATVFHYERDNLQPGERISEWVTTKRDR